MPMPVSVMLTRANCPSTRLESVTVPPPGESLTALLTRLLTTWTRRPRSPGALRLERLRQLVRGLAHRGDVLDHHQHMLGPAARVGDGRRGQLQPQPLAGARRRADLDA